ncbi:MAG: magnesium-translocating P-type ATPase [Candidatus Paracaedibacteraceae bacterium]|nr:magnesium-translocating P-type ATPase [Candidatus Paracaedibacteraceae bacterium]
MHSSKKSNKLFIKSKEQFISQEIWDKSIDELFDYLKSSSQGISSQQARLRLRKYGPNTFSIQSQSIFFYILLKQFKNPFLIMLLTCASLTGYLGEVSSFIIISLIISISMVIGISQEYVASRQVECLKTSVVLKSQVLRDGKIVEVLSDSIVPGDVVFLSAGDLVPGDGRILVAKNLFVDQSFITGESLPVSKSVCKEGETIQNFSESYSTIFTGSAIISGIAKILICRTGKNAFLGILSQKLNSPLQGSPFLKDMNKYSLFIMRITLLMVLGTFTVNLFLYRPWLDSLLFSLALGVGMTPEFMPMIISVCLARAARLMSNSKLIVKRISFIYDLGSMNILCTDKTGTLTEGILDVVGYINAQGEVNHHCFELAYLNSFFETGYKSPLDQAIMHHASINTSIWRKVDEVPFDFQHRRISVLLEKDKERFLILKGPLEDILDASHFIEDDSSESFRPLNKQDRKSIINQFQQLSRQGFRVLGVSWQIKPSNYSVITPMDEKGLIFCGLLIFSDRPKESAKQALKALEASGIMVKIITGDNEFVTCNLCDQLDIPINGILTSKQLGEMTDIELESKLKNTNIFCQVTPDQKERIVQLLKLQGNIVGFMGDGINDTLALHCADVSISVDNAVDVAKEAASFILLEKNLNVIYQGVMEGRKTFANIMKYSLMATSANFGNMISMIIASFILPFLPMLPIQILLNNLLYDIAGLGLPFDHVDSEVLVRPSKWSILHINKFMAFMGSISSVFDIGTFYILIFFFQDDQCLFHTGWFIESLTTQILVIYILRSQRMFSGSPPHGSLIFFSIIALCIGVVFPYLPWGTFFGLVPLPSFFFIILLAIIFTYLLTVKIGKRIFSFLTYSSLNKINTG